MTPTATTPRGAPRRAARPWPRRKRRGLIGVLLTVAVAAAVIVGLLGIYGRVNTSIRTQSTQALINAAEAELRRAYANQPQYDRNMTAVLWSVMPANAIQGAGATRRIVTPWGGQVVAGGGDNPNNTGVGAAAAADRQNRFFVTVLDLPEAACESLAAAFLNRADVESVHPEGAGGDPGGEQATVAAIQVECDGGDDDSVGIVFRG